jgi:multidrug efflux pump subunit AcrA (membrane-fusion protein)
LADQHGFRIDVAVGSDDVGHLCVGLPARIKLDAYDYQKYGTVTGRVVFVSPDSQIPDAPANLQCPTYRVKIALDAQEVGRDQLRGRIKLGMTGVAEIVTDQESILSLLIRSIRRSVSLG